MTTNWFQYDASTFADPDDVEAFRRCKERGGTDQECFLVGDNGIGCWGDNTAQADEHFIALHADDLVARWGSLANAKHRLVQIVKGDKICLARVGDRCGVPGRIDLNPACQATLDIRPGSLVPVRWRWME